MHSYYVFQGVLPHGLNYTMFYIAVTTLGSEEQKKKYLPLIQNFRISGCYAQTELGHGSNVAGLETTATYDKSKGEYVIHSPTITATKYWPGDMGLFCTHAVVFARLISNGQDHGVQPFIVQIRDPQSFDPVRGCEMGDIGPKFGYQSKNNGYLIFNNLRVSKEALLSRFVEIDGEGNMHKKGDLRILYSTMLATRVDLVSFAPKFLYQGLTIAGRYAVVRRQFKNEEGSKLERKIMDYQTHQWKLIPLLAYSYGMSFMSKEITDNYYQMMRDVDNGKFDLLDIMHHYTSGCKAFYSDITYNGLDTLRQACGGAGFSAHSGLPQLQVEYSPHTTFEGDNTVLS